MNAEMFPILPTPLFQDIPGMPWPMQPLTLDDREPVHNMLRRFPPKVSELTFSNLAGFNDPQRWFGFYNSHLMITSGVSGFINPCCVMQPVGPDPRSVMRDLSGKAPIVWDRVDARLAIELEDELRICELDEHHDYVYLQSKLADLSGSDFGKARNEVRGFSKKFEPEVCSLSGQNKAECLRIHEQWLDSKAAHEYLAKEDRAIRLALANFDAWSLSGVGIYIEGHMQAFGIGEPLNPETYVVHFMKSAQNIRGLPTFLLQQLAIHLGESFEYINLMQDLGLPNLRMAKASWRPDHQVRKYRLWSHTLEMDT